MRAILINFQFCFLNLSFKFTDVLLALKFAKINASKFRWFWVYPDREPSLRDYGIGTKFSKFKTIKFKKFNFTLKFAL